MKRARPRRTPVFVCGKCLRRHGDGKAIRRALKTRARDCDAKLVRSACLGVCPKKAVVVATQGSLADGKVALIATVAEADALRP